MLWVCFLASIQLYTLWVRGIQPSTDPEAYLLIIPRSGPRKQSMLSWRSVGYVFVHVTPMFVRLIGYVFCSIRTQQLYTFAILVDAGLGNLPHIYIYIYIYIYVYTHNMYIRPSRGRAPAAPAWPPRRRRWTPPWTSGSRVPNDNNKNNNDNDIVNTDRYTWW